GLFALRFVGIAWLPLSKPISPLIQAEVIAPDRVFPERRDESAMGRLRIRREPRWQRQGAFPHGDDLAGRHDGRPLRKDKLRLARADQLDIDLAQKFGMEQRAMLGASRIID